MNLKNERKQIKPPLVCFGDPATVKPGDKAEVVPECLQLVPLLQFPQFPLDFVEEVGALEAAAVAVEADDDGAEAADQNRGPVHPELFRHHLPAGRTVPAGEYRQNENQNEESGEMFIYKTVSRSGDSWRNSSQYDTIQWRITIFTSSQILSHEY